MERNFLSSKKSSHTNNYLRFWVTVVYFFLSFFVQGRKCEFTFQFVSTFSWVEKVLYVVKWSIIKLNYLMINLGMHILKVYKVEEVQFLLSHNGFSRVPKRVRGRKKSALKHCHQTKNRIRKVFHTSTNPNEFKWIGHALQLILNTITDSATNIGTTAKYPQCLRMGQQRATMKLSIVSNQKRKTEPRYGAELIRRDGMYV